MSRSTKGKKGAGWDYWGKRPLQGGATANRARNKRKQKQDGIQRERAILKKELNKAKDEQDC